MFLLDANALIALGDRDHEHHGRVRAWFKASAAGGWATCPIVENAFVRIVSHPSYPNRPGPPDRVRDLLASMCLYPGHQFWPDGLSILDTRRTGPLEGVGSRDITDLYLLALAVSRSARLATLDTRIRSDAIPDGSRAQFVIPMK